MVEPINGYVPRPNFEWQTLLMNSRRGTYLGNTENIRIALEHAPEFSGKLALDRAGLIRSLAHTPAGPAGPWNDASTTFTTCWLNRKGLPVKSSDVNRTIYGVASQQRYDPIKEWARALRWDGKSRLDNWMTTYLGAEQSSVNEIIGTKLLIGIIARAIEPGCRMDYMTVLEGDQGVRKSQSVQALGGEFTCQHLPDLTSRDAIQIANNYLIVEDAELGALSKTRREALKAFLTRTEDVIIQKYQNFATRVARGCVVIGTTNPDGTGYLNDRTGNRRFWPVLVGQCNPDAIAHDREQLFAEAKARLDDGCAYWIENAEENAMLALVQNERMEADDLEWIVSDYIGGRTEVTTWEIARDALTLTEKDIASNSFRGTQVRIGLIMKDLGWHRIRVREGEVLRWVYRKNA